MCATNSNTKPIMFLTIDLSKEISLKTQCVWLCTKWCASPTNVKWRNKRQHGNHADSSTSRAKEAGWTTTMDADSDTWSSWEISLGLSCHYETNKTSEKIEKRVIWFHYIIQFHINLKLHYSKHYYTQMLYHTVTSRLRLGTGSWHWVQHANPSRKSTGLGCRCLPFQ